MQADYPKLALLPDQSFRVYRPGEVDLGDVIPPLYLGDFNPEPSFFDPEEDLDSCHGVLRRVCGDELRTHVGDERRRQCPN